MDYLAVQRGTVPRWYTFAVEPHGHMKVRMHPAAWANVVANATQASNVIFDRADQARFTLGDYVPPQAGRWGIGQCLTTTISDLVDVSWHCPRFIDRNGDGDWPALYSLARSLEALFFALKVSPDSITSAQPQLAVVDGWIVQAEIYGGALSVSIGPDFVSRLMTFSSADFDLVTKQMMNVYYEMWPAMRRLYRPIDFRVQMHERGLHLSCPGNACGLDPDWGDVDQGQGYRLHPHNTDSPVQQLTLLAGIAALCELYDTKSD